MKKARISAGLSAYRQIQLTINQFVITKDCQNPEAAFKMADWMWSEEGSMAGRMGVEGVDWRKPEPGENVQTQFPDKFDVFFITLLKTGATQNSHWVTSAPCYLPSRIFDGEARNENAPEHLMGRDRYGAYLPDEYVTKLILEGDENEEFAELKATIKPYIDESLARFAVGDLDIEKDWDAYLAELDAMQLDRYIELAQIGFDRYAK